MFSIADVSSDEACQAPSLTPREPVFSGALSQTPVSKPQSSASPLDHKPSRRNQGIHRTQGLEPCTFGSEMRVSSFAEPS
jgi:hypothetical protein